MGLILFIVCIRQHVGFCGWPCCKPGACSSLLILPIQEAYYGLLPLMIIFKVLGDRGSTCHKDTVPVEKSESTLSSLNKNISPSFQNVLDVDDKNLLRMLFCSTGRGQRKEVNNVSLYQKRSSQSKSNKYIWKL